MSSIRHSRFAILLCIAAALAGCSSSDKAEPAASGGKGGHGSIAGSGAGGANHVAGAAAVGIGAVAGSAEGGSVTAAGSGGVALGLGGAGAPGTAGGSGALSALGGTSSHTGGATSAAVAGAGGSASQAGAGGAVSQAGAASTVVWSWGQQGNEAPLADPDWVVDSVRSANEGTTAAHPPALAAATPVELTIDCGGQAHTELSLYLAKSSLIPALDILVDGAVRHQFRTNDGTWGFKKYVLDVPPGVHTYAFRASSSSDAASSFALDSIVCTKNAPAIATNSTVDFDRGFVPPETVGAWFVDNLVGTYSDGSTTSDEAAIHPPALQANTAVDMTFSCAHAHTELIFYLAKFTLAPALDLLVDGVPRYKFLTNDGTWGFKKFVFDVPQGTHSYTFRAQSASDAATSFAVDFVQCKNTAPAIATNSTVDFDEGFVPPETGGGWVVDNAVGTYSDGSATSDEAAIHPPALQANAPVDMTFSCAQTHTELSFHLAKFTLIPTMELLVDGVPRYKFLTNDGTWGFKKFVFDVPQGMHSYTFRAQSTSDAATSFAVDYVQCTNNTPAVATNATVDFDRGFVPPEATGDWFVDNLVGTYSDGSTTSDEAAIHPPSLSANTPVDMIFDCGQTAHSQLTFYMAKFSLTPTLVLLMDGTTLQDLTSSGTWGYKKYTFTVASGKHAYTFRAQSASDAATSFAVDFIQCTP